MTHQLPSELDGDVILVLSSELAPIPCVQVGECRALECHVVVILERDAQLGFAAVPIEL
jgi:hypothetical protein